MADRGAVEVAAPRALKKFRVNAQDLQTHGYTDGVPSVGIFSGTAVDDQEESTAIRVAIASLTCLVSTGLPASIFFLCLWHPLQTRLRSSNAIYVLCVLY